MRFTGTRAGLFPYGAVGLILAFCLRVFVREQVRAGDVRNVNRYVGIPVVRLCTVNGGFNTAKLFASGKQRATLRDLRQESARELKCEKRGMCVTIARAFGRLFAFRGTERIAAIHGSVDHDRFGRIVRRVATANRTGACILYAVWRPLYYFCRVFQSFLRNCASRRHRRLFFALYVEFALICSFLREKLREVCHVIRNGTFNQVLVMVISSHLADRFARTRGAVDVVRAILFGAVCDKVRVASTSIGVHYVGVSGREFTACLLNVSANEVDRPIVYVGSIGLLLAYRGSNRGKVVISFLVRVIQVAS